MTYPTQITDEIIEQIANPAAMSPALYYTVGSGLVTVESRLSPHHGQILVCDELGSLDGYSIDNLVNYVTDRLRDYGDNPIELQWWALRAYNQETRYGCGTREEADDYCAHLNRDRAINCYAVDGLMLDNPDHAALWYELETTRDDGMQLEVELMQIAEDGDNNAQG